MDAHGLAAISETPDVTLFSQMGKGDDRLAVRFFKKAVPNHELSAEGHVRFKEVDYIHIMVPGDRDNIIIRPAGDGDKLRFRDKYKMYLEGVTGEQVIGTPLEAWNRMTLAQVEEFRYIGVRTVEQLAVLNDQACMKFPGATTLKLDAQKFLDMLKAEAPVQKMQAELAERDNTITALQAQMKEMQEQMRQMQEERAKKR